MKTVYSPLHEQHAPKTGFSLGKIIESFEKPERAQAICDELTKRGAGPFLAPERLGHETILRIHSPAYVEFLQNAHREWAAGGFEGDAMGSIFSLLRGRNRPPKHIDAKLGYYMGDTIVSLSATSWPAIEASAFTALTAQKLVLQGEKAAFALCRPPGHHAGRDVAAGYCFLNNAAIAAQGFLDGGLKKVAILDVDYHHGDGTQSIFYARNDVFCVSLHADPDVDYPYFSGHVDETGEGKGEGFNKNYPLPHGTGWEAYSAALTDAIDRIRSYGPEALIVPLGVDTFEKDPISLFKLKNEDYLRLGAAVAGLNVPTLFVMEGGYAISDIGVNVANVLDGFEAKA